VAVTGGVPTLSDQRTAEQIEKQLAYAKTFDGTCIEVHVYGEDVFLRGRLPSLHAKVEAGLLASTVRGVERVHNQIRIEKPG
jgi:osmotically-inducible protein OsmY